VSAFDAGAGAVAVAFDRVSDVTDVSDAGDQAGAQVLDAVEEILCRFVAFPNEAARVAVVLWCAHTHMLNAFETTPRLALLSPEPGSGKTRALEILELLVHRPLLTVNVTPAYLFRKVGDEAGPPTLLYDEIDTVFGPKAKDNEDIRGMLKPGIGAGQRLVVVSSGARRWRPRSCRRSPRSRSPAWTTCPTPS